MHGKSNEKPPDSVQQSENMLQSIVSDRMRLMRRIADNRWHAIAYTSIVAMLVLLYWAVGLMLVGLFPDSIWIYATIITLCLVLAIVLVIIQISYRHSIGIKLSALTMLPQGEFARKASCDRRVSSSNALIIALTLVLPWPSMIIGYAYALQYWPVAMLYAIAAAAIVYGIFRRNQHMWVEAAEGISHEI